MTRVGSVTRLESGSRSSFTMEVKVWTRDRVRGQVTRRGSRLASGYRIGVGV